MTGLKRIEIHIVVCYEAGPKAMGPDKSSGALYQTGYSIASHYKLHLIFTLVEKKLGCLILFPFNILYMFSTRGEINDYSSLFLNILPHCFVNNNIAYNTLMKALIQTTFCSQIQHWTETYVLTKTWI